MTEKRFTTDYYNFVRDDLTYIKDNNARMTYEQIVDLLNELAEENEQLKQFNQELNDELQETMGYLALKSGIEKENEQLKEENKKLESLWEDKCIREYMEFVGENALREMHNEKYGDK